MIKIKLIKSVNQKKHKASKSQTITNGKVEYCKGYLKKIEKKKV